MSLSVPSPEALRPHYSKFLAQKNRILLSGHSHQAWPDVAREGVIEAFDDAAELVDDKWGRAAAKADQVRDFIAKRIGAQRDEIALGLNTLELLGRLLSGLDLKKSPHIVTTSGEFHSLYRLLTELEKRGLEVTWVAAQPVETLSQRLGAALRETTAALMVSNVLFETATVVPGLGEVCRAASEQKVLVVLDSYHSFNVVPFSIEDYGPDVYVVGGGYKYAQFGEGCGFLRVPPSCDLEPALTGWFSDFANLDSPRGGPIGYGRRAADRFAGATYDPTCHYRAARVIQLFDELDLSVQRLRALSLTQTGRLIEGLGELEILTPRDPERRGGFVAVRHPQARKLCSQLKEHDVWTDARGEVLRLGPAPYVLDSELDRGIETLLRLAK